MSLKNYCVPTTEVTIGDGKDGDLTVAVYGLSATAISALVQAQGDMLRTLYGRALAGEFDATDVETLLQIVLDEAPLLVGLVIAYGLDEPESWEKATKMPFGDQVVLVDAVIRTTFVREGGLGKVLEIIRRAMSLTTAAKEVRETLMSGSEE